MQWCKLSNKAFIGFFIIYSAISLWLIYITPFTNTEADILYSNSFSLTSYITKTLYSLTNSVFFIRLIFFITSTISLFLMFKITNRYLDKEYRNLALFIYLITPGVFVSFLIVNYATFAIFLTLLFIYSYQKGLKALSFLALVLLFFSHTGSFVVYIASALYAYKIKDISLLLISIVLLTFSSIYANYPIDGIPKGHLVQLFGIYAAIFSPLYFLAVVYTIYRFIKEKKYDLLWYIVATSFIVSLILSIRQKIQITDFAPYIVIVAPLVVYVFKNSLSIRLKPFRKNYYIVCITIISVLLLETLITALEYPLFKYFNNNLLLIDKSIYEVPKNVAKLKNKNISCIKRAKNRDLNLYRFYNIKLCK